MEFNEITSAWPRECSGHGILFRSDFADDESYYTQTFRCIEQHFGKYRGDYKLVSRGTALSVCTQRRIGGMFTVTSAAVDMDSGNLNLDHRLLITEPEERLLLLNHILAYPDETLQSVKFTMTEDGFCRIHASRSWNISGAFSERFFRNVLANMDAALFRHWLERTGGRSGESKPVNQIDVTDVLCLDPGYAFFPEDMERLFGLLRKEMGPVSADSDMFAEEEEEDALRKNLH